MVDGVQVKKVEKLKGLERKIVMEIPESEYTQACNNELMKLAKTQSLKGFRQGKVPLSVVKKRFGQDVKLDILQQLMKKYFYLGAMQKKMQPVSAPALEIVSDNAGEPVVFSATFEIYPEITIPSLKSLKLTRMVTTVDNQAVEDMLKKLQTQHGDWDVVERAAKQGDQLSIDFEGKLKGEVFEGGTAKDAILEIGANQYIPGFEEGLAGVKTGDEKSLKLKFPKEYHDKDLAGKAVVFDVKVNTIKAKTLPEFDEEFVKKMGIESGKLDDLKTEVETTMLRESQKGTQQQVKEELFKALTQKAKIEVPLALIDSEIAAMQEELKTKMQQQGQAPQNFPELPREHFEQQATDRVKLGLLMNEFIRKEEIKVNPDTVRERIEDVAAQYQDPQEVITWYQEHEEQRSKLESMVLEEQVVELMLNQAKITEQRVSYELLMNPKPT